jgi:hypothetical protein
MTQADDLTPADREAVDRILACRPVLAGLETAREALGLAEGALGHAGPPFRSRDEIPAVVLGALAGAAVHEGWAGSIAQAGEMVLSGEIALHANHELGTVSPMAGVVRPSQPLMRVENADGPGTTWATFAEAGRRALRFGVYDAAAADGLRHVDAVIAPAIAAALPGSGLPVWPLVAHGLTLGDDTHQRNIGGMAAFLAALPDLPNDVRAWLTGVPQHFLNYAMAAAKLCLDRASGVHGARIVTALTRNGVDCAIRVAGTGDAWHRAPASHPVGGFFEGFGQADAQPDLGDSAIVETFGLGGCTAHSSPEIARTMGRDWTEARSEGARMRGLFAARSPHFDPALAGPEGLGAGLHAARAARAGGVRIHTGIAHRDGATGWIGIGVARAPAACFEAALAALAETRETEVT